MLKVGDEVVCIGSIPLPQGCKFPAPPVGHVGFIVEIGEAEEGFYIELDNWPEEPGFGLDASLYRKVQRRDLTAWLATENTIEGPVRRKVSA